MPFYLTHQQVMVPIAAGASWVPYLSKFVHKSVPCSKNSGNWGLGLAINTHRMSKTLIRFSIGIIVFYTVSNHDLIIIFEGSLPVLLLLSTLATLAVSWLITRAGPVRYR